MTGDTKPGPVDAASIPVDAFGVTSWPLVGRLWELGRIRAVLGGKVAGTGVLLVGAPGVGKTRLAEEVVGDIARRTVVTLVGTAAAQAIPLAPLLAVFPDITAAPQAGIAAAVARLSGRRPRPVLFIDDAHWLDPTTQTLVHLLVRARQVRLVATARDDLPLPDTILDLWKNGHLERIDLATLDAGESAQLVAAIIGAPPEASVVAELHARSQGVPLALRELTTEALTTGALMVQNGLGHAVRPLPSSRRLRDVITNNLTRLAPGPREVLNVVAVAEPVALPLLLRIVREHDIDAAHEQGAIRITRSRLDRADWHVVTAGHPLYAEAALAASVGRGRRRILAHLIDAAGGLAGRNDALTLRLASWCLEIGRPVPVKDLLSAVRLTHRALDADHAERFAQELWRERPDYETGVLYAVALGRQLKYEQASEVYLTLKDLDLTEPQRTTRAALANEAMVRLGRHAHAIAELSQAEALAQDRRLRAHLIARRAMTTSLGGSPRRGIDIILPLVNGGDVDEFREAAAFAPTLLALDGRTDEAMELVDRGVRIGNTAGAAAEGSVPLDVQWAAFERGLVLLYAGRLIDATEHAERGVRDAEEHGSQFLLGGWLNLLGRIALDRGHATAAILALGRAVSETAAASGGMQRTLALNALVEAHALLGQVRPAQEALAGFRKNPGNIQWYPPGLAKLAQGHLAIRTGPAQAGLDLFRKAYQTALPNSAVMALTAAHTIARFGQRTEGQRLARAVAPIQGPLAALRLAHMDALVDQDITALLDVATGFEHLGADLLAAEAFGAAATEAVRQHDIRQVKAATRMGHQILRRLDGIHTPDLHGLTPGPSNPLTPREREIATMAAAGKTSQTIAETMTLSVRTVDNHLQRAYAKLGISRRSELAPALNTDTQRQPSSPHPSTHQPVD